jgi:hypothetical protein
MWGHKSVALTRRQHGSSGEVRGYFRSVVSEPARSEQELHRARLLGVTSYTIDRHVQIQVRSTCAVTNHRGLVQDESGNNVRLRSGDIRTVRMHRTYDAADGFSCTVVLERQGSLPTCRREICTCCVPVRR